MIRPQLPVALTLLLCVPALADEPPIAAATVEDVWARVMAAGADHARAQGWNENGPVWSFEHSNLDIYQGDDLSLGSHSYNGGGWVEHGALAAIVEASQAVPAAERAGFQERALAFAFARAAVNKSDLEDGKDLDPHAAGIYARLGLAAPSAAELDVAIEILTESRIRALGPSHGIEFFFSGFRRKMRAARVRRRYGSAKAQRKRFSKLIDEAQAPQAGMADALN